MLNSKLPWSVEPVLRCRCSKYRLTVECHCTGSCYLSAPGYRGSAPSSLNQLRSFLGLAGYYRRFIPFFSRTAAPLLRLQIHGSTFKWTPGAQSAFDDLKTCLTSAPLLAFPRFAVDFLVATDACDTGLGAVLSHQYDGQEHVIAYASRSLSKAEKSCNTTEKEALAVVWAASQFRPYLYGRRFTLITDHCPLTCLKSLKEPRGRLARWMASLSEYEWDIRHKPGHRHGNADGLSRRPPQTTDSCILGEHQHADVVESDCLYPLSAEGDPGITSDVCAAVGFGSGPSDIITAQPEDEILQKVVHQMPAGEDGGGNSDTAETLSGSGASPWLETMCLRYFTEVRAKWHFAGFNLSPADARRIKTASRRLICSSNVAAKTIISSR